ncbi:hypothetical protein FHG87_022839 [Trinorchestia longiramus]|nr:hypothetical protein FHG87_022839 [Trinorchestia longiramus]
MIYEARVKDERDKKLKISKTRVQMELKSDVWRKQVECKRDSNPGLPARKQIRSPVDQAGDTSRPSW